MPIRNKEKLDTEVQDVSCDCPIALACEYLILLKGGVDVFPT